MIDHLIAHIARFIPVFGHLSARLAEISEEKVLQKGKLLHRPGRVCNYTYFIHSGLLRIFYKKGRREVTDNFAAEGEWITSVYSIMKNVPDICYIGTLERCELLAISMAGLEECFRDFPEMERFGQLLISKYFMEQSERIVSLQFHTARERYAFFLKTAGSKTLRVPLGMLASHLGIAPETLSRIRAERSVF